MASLLLILPRTGADRRVAAIDVSPTDIAIRGLQERANSRWLSGEGLSESGFAV